MTPSSVAAAVAADNCSQAASEAAVAVLITVSDVIPIASFLLRINLERAPL